MIRENSFVTVGDVIVNINLVAAVVVTKNTVFINMLGARQVEANPKDAEELLNLLKQRKLTTQFTGTISKL